MFSDEKSIVKSYLILVLIQLNPKYENYSIKNLPYAKTAIEYNGIQFRELTITHRHFCEKKI